MSIPMSYSGNSRYKPWKLFKRYSNIQLPQLVIDLDLSQPHINIDEDDNLDSTPMVSLSCSFAPDDACTVVCHSTFINSINRINTIGELSSSFVSVWQIDEDGAEFDECMFSYSPVPYPTFSKCGNICCIILNGSHGKLQVFGYKVDEDEKYFYETPLKCLGSNGNLCGRTKCLVMDYDRAVTVTNLKMGNDLYDCVLSLWRINENIQLKHLWTKELKRICRIEYLIQTSIQQCVFSPCSNFIGILLCSGQFLLIDCDHQNCITEINFFELMSSQQNQLPTYEHPIVFCFDPNFNYQMVVISYFERIHFIDITRTYEKKEEIKYISLPDADDSVKDVCYSKNGRFLSVCSRNGHVLIYSVKQNYELLHMLSIPGDSTTVGSIQAYSASFSSSSEELIVAHSKAIVSVYQLPKIVNLKEICRLRIHTLLSRNCIDSLEVPNILKQYLKFYPGLG